MSDSDMVFSAPREMDLSTGKMAVLGASLILFTGNSRVKGFNPPWYSILQVANGGDVLDFAYCGAMDRQATVSANILPFR